MVAREAPETAVGELLPGEDSAVADPVEIQHWVSLYEERREIWRRRVRRARDPEARARLLAYAAWVDAVTGPPRPFEPVIAVPADAEVTAVALGVRRW